MKKSSLGMLVFLLLAGCSASKQSLRQDVNPDARIKPPCQAEIQKDVDQDPIQQERDTIYSLLAYAVVFKDWQTKDTDPARGHNIGSVLVNPGGDVVFWARNCNKITGNGTQHGEVRLMHGYLAKVKTYNLKNFIVYTTLEPCAMCSGMMALQSIGRTVYGQTDPDFGKAIERLQLDSKKLPNGYKPYPRTENLVSEPAQNEFRARIDAAYKKYQDQGGKSLTGWLLSDEAKALYKQAVDAFNRFKVEHQENQQIYQKAKDFLKTVPDHYVPNRYSDLFRHRPSDERALAPISKAA